MLLHKVSSFQLQFKAFSDFDWATSPTVHKSITGVYVFLEDSLIS